MSDRKEWDEQEHTWSEGRTVLDLEKFPLLWARIDEAEKLRAALNETVRWIDQFIGSYGSGTGLHPNDLVSHEAREIADLRPMTYINARRFLQGGKR